MARDNVDIAKFCGPDGPGIESRWDEIFRPPSRPVVGPTQLPIQWVPVFISGGKAAGAWR